MDMAWDSAAYEAARASQIARGHDLERYHDDACSHVKAWRKSDAYRERPFRFEDLNGACEPEKWGPVYPKSASASVEKWRSIARGRRLEEDEAAEYGRAVGAWIRGPQPSKSGRRTRCRRARIARAARPANLTLKSIGRRFAPNIVRKPRAIAWHGARAKESARPTRPLCGRSASARPSSSSGARPPNAGPPDGRGDRPLRPTCSPAGEFKGETRGLLEGSRVLA